MTLQQQASVECKSTRNTEATSTAAFRSSRYTHRAYMLGTLSTLDCCKGLPLMPDQPSQLPCIVLNCCLLQPPFPDHSGCMLLPNLQAHIALSRQPLQGMADLMRNALIQALDCTLGCAPSTPCIVSHEQLLSAVHKLWPDDIMFEGVAAQSG